MSRESRSPNRRRPKRKSSTSDEPEEFILESIKGKRTSPQTGEIEYFIKWKGFPAATNTWETVSSIQQWQNVIDAYEKETEESETISSTTPAGASSPKPKRSRRGSASSCSSTDSRSRSTTSTGPQSQSQKPRSKRSRRGSGSSCSSTDSRSRSPTSTTGPEASAARKVTLPMGPPPPKKSSTPKKVPKVKFAEAPSPCKAKSSIPHTQYEIFGYKNDAYCYRIVVDEDEAAAQPSTSKGLSRISTSHTPRGLLRKYSPIGLAESFEACVVSGDGENSISIPEFEQEVGTKHDEPPFNYTVADSVPEGLVPIRVLALIKYQSELVYYVEWRPLGEVDDEDGPDIQKSYTLVKGSALKKEFSEAMIKFYDTLLLMDNTWACVCGKQRNETDKSAPKFKGKPVKFQLDRVLERSNVHDIESGRHTRGMELMYYTECPVNAEVDKILNVYIHEELPCYVVKWKGESDAVLVRGSEFRKHHPQAVIGFFQSRIKWVKPRVD